MLDAQAELNLILSAALPEGATSEASYRAALHRGLRPLLAELSERAHGVSGHGAPSQLGGASISPPRLPAELGRRMLLQTHQALLERLHGALPGVVELRGACEQYAATFMLPLRVPSSAEAQCLHSLIRWGASRTDAHRPVPTHPSPLLSSLLLSHRILSHRILSHPIPSHPIPPRPAQSQHAPSLFTGSLHHRIPLHSIPLYSIP